MIQVVNKHKHTTSIVNDIYIGRGSIVGNPWSWHDGTEARFKVKNREEALAKYAPYAEWARMNNAHFAKYFDTIVDRELQGLQTNLVCYCKPQDCHGDIIKRMVCEKIENFQK